MENHDGHRDGPIPSMNEFMREMVKIDDDICHISHQKQIDLAHQPGHSSWFVSPSEFHANLSWPLDGEVMSTTNIVRENGPNERVDNTTPIGNNLMDVNGWDEMGEGFRLRDEQFFNGGSKTYSP